MEIKPAPRKVITRRQLFQLIPPAVVAAVTSGCSDEKPKPTRVIPATPLPPTRALIPPTDTQAPLPTAFPTAEGDIYNGKLDEIYAAQKTAMEKEVNAAGYNAYEEAKGAIPQQLLDSEACLITVDNNNKLYGGTMTKIYRDEELGIDYYLTVAHIVQDYIGKKKSGLIKTISLHTGAQLDQKTPISLDNITGYVDGSSDLGMFAVKSELPPVASTYDNIAYDTCNNPATHEGEISVYGFPYLKFFNKKGETTKSFYRPYFTRGETDKDKIFGGAGCFIGNNNKIPYLAVTTKTAEGLSGSPMINENGEIIALVDYISPNGTIAAPIPSKQLIEDMKLFSRFAGY